MKFKSYMCVYIDKINWIPIFIDEKSNREILGFFKYLGYIPSKNVTGILGIQAEFPDIVWWKKSGVGAP